MFDERDDIPRGRVVHYGAARIMRGAGDRRIVKRALVVEFEDTEGLEEAVNSGFAEFDMGDDTVAVVLESKPKG